MLHSSRRDRGVVRQNGEQFGQPQPVSVPVQVIQAFRRAVHGSSNQARVAHLDLCLCIGWRFHLQVRGAAEHGGSSGALWPAGTGRQWIEQVFGSPVFVGLLAAAEANSQANFGCLLG